LVVFSVSAEAETRTSFQKPQGMELCSGNKCIGHLASKSEIEEILAHPLFNAFSQAIFDKIKERQSAVAKRQGVLIGMFGQTLAPEIRYENYDAFMAAQSADRRQNLPPRLPKIHQMADDLFSSALREYLDQRSAHSPDKGAIFEAAITKFLGPHVLECWRRPVGRKSQSVDAGGMLHVSTDTVNEVSNSCFDTMSEDHRRFQDLVQIREWHPYLWDSMSKTYAFLRRFLTAQEKAQLPPIPQPLLVDQNSFASNGGMASEVATPPAAAAIPPVYKRGKIASMVSPDDYPESIFQRSRGGTVYVRLTVDSHGRLERCDIEQTSGNSDFDQRTCNLLTRRIVGEGQFTPSRDASGYPTTGSTVVPISFRSN
jgi:TonB family protein